MRILSLCVSLCTLTMILSSCHTQRQMESLTVDSTNIHHAFNSTWLFDLCDTITICTFDTMGQPQKKAQVIRHRRQAAQTTAKDTTSQRRVQLTHKTTTTDSYQKNWELYDAIISWTFLVACLLFLTILYKRLHL